MNDLRFAKLQASGNDFLVVVVDDVKELRTARELAQQMCHRHFGAGADGLIFVTRARHGDADFASRIFNADGGEAEISGNGTRCVAAYLSYSGLWSEPEVRIATGAGVKRGRLIGRDELHFEFEFDMGQPRFASSDIPMSLDQPLESVVAYALMIGGEAFEVTCVSMGNPHCSLFFPTFDGLNLAELGPLIEDHPVFPKRTNVEFVRIITRGEIEVLFWERGVGQTLSSGTGSCAAAIASASNGVTDRSVRVRTLGGLLRVDWNENNSVTLTGSAEVIYEGRWLGRV